MNRNHTMPLSDLENDLETRLQNHLDRITYQLKHLPNQTIYEIASALNKTRETLSNIYIFGNGGSAATAMHMSNDFGRIFDSKGVPLKVNCLNANISTFSALANDFGYENVFTYQLKGLLRQEDILIGISASGNSPNCVSAFSLAKESKATTIGLLGFDGGMMRELSNYFIHIKEHDYLIVENLHMIISHALTYVLKDLNDIESNLCAQ